MISRTWVITALLLVTCIGNSLLLGMERIDPPEGQRELKDEVSDPLIDIRFTTAQRKDNFRQMGFDDDGADEVTKLAANIMAKRKNEYLSLLKDFSSDVNTFLCTSTNVPQRYSALAFLVVEENGQRKVIPQTTNELVVQEWARNSAIVDVYEKVELTPDRQPDATVMGVAAILTKQEAKVLAKEQPFNPGLLGVWDYGRVKRDYPEVKDKVKQYFAMMYVFTELANGPGGICGA